MPVISSALKRLWVHSLICVFPIVASGQSLVPASSEMALFEAMRGDQIRPQVAFNSSGGMLVWQDNALDGFGYGIAGARLNTDGSVKGNRFRINWNTWGEQEKPDVALFGDGTAAVAWQGLSSVHPNVYARFVTANGTWLTRDIQMSGTTQNLTNKYMSNLWMCVSNKLVYRGYKYQQIQLAKREGNRDPAVAALNNQTAVIVYSGARKYTLRVNRLAREVSYVNGRRYTNDVTRWSNTIVDDMEEIMFQRIGTDGRRYGKEVIVNQFRHFNQRKPAVATLENGNFVVVWVSEQRFAMAPGDYNVVAICGRLFDANGVAVGDEFRIDGSGAAICAWPAVCGTAGGGFRVAWAQQDRETAANIWDIYSRAFDGEGNAAGNAVRVNTTVLGWQHSPDVASLGQEQLVTWTSVGQDGSMEGVYGRLIAEGVFGGNEFRVNTSTRSSQTEATIGAAGGGFRAIWTHFTGVGSGFELMSQRYGVTPALEAPAAPTVAAVGQETLSVSWPEVSNDNLLNYLLYMDDGANGVSVSGTSYDATGLMPNSTHSFRLAYLLSDGQRSRLSTKVLGTTWAAGQTSPMEQAQAEPTVGEPGGGSSGEAGGLVLTRMTLLRNGPKLSAHWNSVPGAAYQLQVSTNLGGWVDVGSPQTATGTTTSQNCDTAPRAAFYRVIRIP